MKRAAEGIPFVSGLDHIEPMGAVSHYVMYFEKPNGSNIYQRTHPIEFIMPNSALPDAIRQAMQVHCTEAVLTVRKFWRGISFLH